MRFSSPARTEPPDGKIPDNREAVATFIVRNIEINTILAPVCCKRGSHRPCTRRSLRSRWRDPERLSERLVPASGTQPSPEANTHPDSCY